jgi:hypothetical protein
MDKFQPKQKKRVQTTRKDGTERELENKSAQTVLLNVWTQMRYEANSRHDWEMIAASFNNFNLRFIDDRNFMIIFFRLQNGENYDIARATQDGFKPIDDIYKELMKRAKPLLKGLKCSEDKSKKNFSVEKVYHLTSDVSPVFAGVRSGVGRYQIKNYKVYKINE